VDPIIRGVMEKCFSDLKNLKKASNLSNFEYRRFWHFVCLLLLKGILTPLNMKKVSYFLSLALILIGLSGNYSVSAQGRGQRNGHGNNNGERSNGNRDRDNGSDTNHDHGNDWNKGDNDRHDHDRRGNANWNRGNNGNHYGHRKGDNRWDYDRDGHNHNNWERRNVNQYYHTHDRYCGHTIVVHNYARPRYIYYRDYDVYYDCHSSVYISYSGRSWTVSAALPFAMRHINIRAANRYEVDYWDDNLPVYLERRRPTCDRVYFGG
jgi:hypothetical protein